MKASLQRVSAALELKPKLFLMENVPGMQSARRDETSFLEAAAGKLEKEGGYRTEIWRLNAAAFGVPNPHLGTEMPVVVCEMRELPDDATRLRLQQDIREHVQNAPTMFGLPPVEAL